MSHTPGPWKMLHYGAPPCYEVESETLCVAHGIWDEDDARLMTSAPDLLAVAIRLRDSLRTIMAAYQPPDGDDWELCEQECQIASEIINDATGGTP